VGNGGTGYDWYVADATTGQNNELWGTVKTIFDPCPSGWKVAPMGTWDDFTADGSAAPEAEAFGGTLFAYHIDGKPQTANGTPPYVSSARNGRQYTPTTGNVKAWYPVAGSYSMGGLAGCGNSVRYSSSSVSNYTNMQLNSNNIDIYPSGGATRAWGYPVRCLQE
jgi:hypothetical protein